MIARGAAATTPGEGRAATEQRGEELAEVLFGEPAVLGARTAPSRAARSPPRAPGMARAAGTARAARELEAAAPVRGRPELLAGFPVGAELIVCSALLGVLQHLVRLLH